MIRSRILVLVPVVGLFVLGIILGLYACGGGGGSSPTAVPVAAVTFPVQIDPTNRFLVDSAGKPFLLHGEAAWSLIAQATDAEVDQYLEDRRQKGFNAILVNLLEHKFADHAPNAINNVPPFTTPGDYSTPNDAYFAHADSVIQKAAAKGILVLLTPSYLGSSGGPEGWYLEMVANDTADPSRLRTYGGYLGQRYKKYSNILWVNGGDDLPPDPPSVVTKIALGIKDFDTRSLHTGHCATEFSAFQCWGNTSWLQINTIYTYTDVHATTLTEYQRTPLMPVFLIEGRYENEDNTNGNGTEQQVRVQAYQALLSGAMGQVFGNNPIWHFSSTATAFPSSQPDWKLWLNSPSTMSMVSLRNLLVPRSWWLLVPDTTNALLTPSVGSGVPYDLAVAAKASDSSFAIVYMPSARQVTVNLGQMAGPKVTARWYDPASGLFSTTAIVGSPFLTSSGSHVLTPPAVANASTSGTFTDWVLVLESTQ